MSPRTQEQIEVIRQQSKQRILEAAFELMAKNGYEATSIAGIAQKANISKGLLYNYYNSKEDLLQNMVQQAFSEGDKVMQDIVADRPDETLRNLFVWFFGELRERPEFWKLITDLTLQADKFQFARDMLYAKLNEYSRFIGDLLIQMDYENPKKESLLIGAIFDGMGLHYIVFREDYPLDEMEQFLIDKYCKKKTN
jgi:AcrR family transcriptional regulator